MANKRPHVSCHLLLSLFLFLLIFPNSIAAATLTLTATRTSPNLHLSLKIDKAERIAGLKITMTYPDEILKFESATKTKATSSFMHIVNDKNPGKLVIVMASAKGISGYDIALFDLSFKFVISLQESSFTSIETTGCQLMTENLKELPCSTTSYMIEF